MRRNERLVPAHSGGLIAELFPSGSINSETQLVIADVLLFQGSWAAAFKKDRTRNEPFHLPDGRTADVPFMNQTGQFRTAAISAGRLLELPYAGHDATFVVLLPERPNGLAELEKQITGPTLAEWLRRLKPDTTAVSLPRFTAAAEHRLEPALRASACRSRFEPSGPTSRAFHQVTSRSPSAR